MLISFLKDRYNMLVYQIIFAILWLLSAAVFAEGPFLQPSEEEIEESTYQVKEEGKSEVFSLPFHVRNQFLWDRYIRGVQKKFSYYGSNPSEISEEKAKRPAILLLHASDSNQGQWLPLLHTLQDEVSSDISCPVFTFNFQEADVKKQLCEKIVSIKEIYQKAGEDKVQLYLVGHSLGAIAAVEYGFDQENWVDRTSVIKVISIAGRLKNISYPEQTPFYPYCYQTLTAIDSLYESIEKNRGLVELYTIAGEKDWLVPAESVLVADNEQRMAIIPEKGHIFVACAHMTRELIIQWLFYNDATNLN